MDERKEVDKYLVFKDKYKKKNFKKKLKNNSN